LKFLSNNFFFRFFVDGVHWLIFIKNQELICKMQNNHEIYRITEILIEPFDDFDEVNN
jgi:hypothetical protein